MVVKYGINHITQLVESGKAQCVGECGGALPPALVLCACQLC